MWRWSFFRCPWVAWHFKTQIRFPAVIQEWEPEKCTLLIELDVKEPYWWDLFPKEVKRRDSTTWFRICQFQTPAKKGYLQMHLLAEWFVFWVWWSGFTERGSQDLSNGTNVASLLTNFFSVFTSIVYDTSYLAGWLGLTWWGNVRKFLS
jgi:hypothetical protein